MEAKPKKKKKSGCLIAVIGIVLLGLIVSTGDDTEEPVETAGEAEVAAKTTETVETKSTETGTEAEEVAFSGVIIDCENSWSLWTGKNFSAFVDDGEKVWYVTYHGDGVEEVKINDTIECIGVPDGEKAYTRDSEEITVPAVAITKFKLYPDPEPETEAEFVKETEPETIVTVPENNPTEYKEGQYKIGSDMPAGVYVLYQQDYSWMSYFAITSDANGKDILENDNFENRSVIEVIDGEFLEIKRCSAFPLEEDPGFGTVNGCILAGSYIIGRDIDPGEYKVEADAGEMAYICIYTDTRRSKIHANDNFEGSRYVALEEGQLFEIKRGRVKIGD